VAELTVRRLTALAHVAAVTGTPARKRERKKVSSPRKDQGKKKQRPRQGNLENIIGPFLRTPKKTNQGHRRGGGDGGSLFLQDLQVGGGDF